MRIRIRDPESLSWILDLGSGMEKFESSDPGSAFELFLTVHGLVPFCYFQSVSRKCEEVKLFFHVEPILVRQNIGWY